MLWRLRYRLWLKLFGISGFMSIFFVLYFELLRHPVRPPLVMPLTALDHAIPFEPMAFYAYVSLWVYVGIAPGLLLSLRALVLYVLWIGGLCLAGLACFYVAPTAVPAFAADIDIARYPGFALLQGADAAGNACPSLHVATAVFSGLCLERLLNVTGAPQGLRLLNWLWLGVIIYSTLAIKQHVVLDVLAGLLLALAFAWPALRWRPADLQ